MPHLYPSKIKGWRIMYRVFFIDGRHVDKTRWAKSKDIAKTIYTDVHKLESLSRKTELSKQEIIYSRNRGYISQEEASQLSSAKISAPFTWNELAKKYEDWSRANCMATTHIRNSDKVKVVLDCMQKYFPGKTPADITKEDVESYILCRKKQGIKNATSRKEHTLIRKLLDYMGSDNPARQVPAPPINDERLPCALSYEDLIVFMQELKKRKAYLRGYLRAVVMLYLYAGLRPSEIIRLTAQDIRAGKIMIHGETKTGMLRSIEIHPKLNVYISTCLLRLSAVPAQAGGGKYLCGGNNQLVPQSISRAIRHILRKIEIDGTPYSLRHTFVTNLLRASNDLRYTMDRAGHKRLSTTTRYLHIIESKESPLKKMKFRA